MMLQGNLHCCDNSGAKKIKFIKNFDVVSQKTLIDIGQIIKVVVVQCSSKSNKIKKASLTKGMIININRNYRRFDSSYTKCDNYCVILLSNKNECIGSRIFAPVPLELRKKKFLKFVFISNKII